MRGAIDTAEIVCNHERPLQIPSISPRMIPSARAGIHLDSLVAMDDAFSIRARPTAGAAVRRSLSPDGFYEGASSAMWMLLFQLASGGKVQQAAAAAEWCHPCLDPVVSLPKRDGLHGQVSRDDPWHIEGIAAA